MSGPLKSPPMDRGIEAAPTDCAAFVFREGQSRGTQNFTKNSLYETRGQRYIERVGTI